MAISVPEKAVQELGLHEAYESEDELLAHLEAGAIELPRWCGPADLVWALTQEPFAQVELVPCKPSDSWRLVEVSVGTIGECQLLEVGDPDASSVPTAAAQALLRAWCSSASLPTLHAAAGHALGLLVCWTAEAKSRRTDANLALSVAGWEIGERLETKPLKARGGTIVEMAPSSLLLREKDVYANLVQGALRHKSPPLRFLYLYRMFERAYLIAALEKLQADFFSDPKESLKDAQSTISSEKNAFISLVEGSGADVAFSNIEAVFASNDASLANRFMIAIARGAREDGDLSYREAWKRGCVLAYKVRCSIVHSGKASPIFESFSDALDACDELNQYMEDAVLTYFDWSVA